MSMDPEGQAGQGLFINREDFWQQNSLETWWDPEADTALAAIDQGKSVILTGPHGIGKSQSFFPRLAEKADTKGYVIAGSSVQDRTRQLGKDPWVYFKESVIDGNEQSQRNWIELALDSSERRQKPDTKTIFIFDEVGFEPENILKAREFLETQNVIPVFLHPMGYQEGRQVMDEWVKAQDGFASIIVEEKLLPQDAVKTILKAVKADQSLIELADEPDARLMLHPRFFNNLLARIMPDAPGQKPIRTLDDLRQWLDFDIPIPGHDGQLPRLFEGQSGESYTITRSEGIFLSKYLKAADAHSFLKRVGVTKPVRQDIVADVEQKSSLYGEEYDPLVYN